MFSTPMLIHHSKYLATLQQQQPRNFFEYINIELFIIYVKVVSNINWRQTNTRGISLLQPYQISMRISIEEVGTERERALQNFGKCLVLVSNKWQFQKLIMGDLRAETLGKFS